MFWKSVTTEITVKAVSMTVGYVNTWNNVIMKMEHVYMDVNLASRERNVLIVGTSHTF
jgi:hypothetical protein